MTEKEFNHKIMPLASDVWSYSLNMTGDKEQAADLTQEVMLRLWDRRQELKKIDNHRAYALKITRNLCLDLLKKSKPVYDEEAVICNGGYDTSLLKEIEDKDTAEAVRRIINTLPPNQKEVMILREIEELDYQEIAHITGLGLNNIRVLLSRARSKVREILIEQYRMSKYEN